MSTPDDDLAEVLAALGRADEQLLTEVLADLDDADPEVLAALGRADEQLLTEVLADPGDADPEGRQA